jgi:hypothetical protein
VEALLLEAETWVGRIPPTPGARELTTRLSRLRHAFEGWSFRKPTAEQRVALREEIDDVLRIARATSPTQRRRPAP